MSARPIVQAAGCVVWRPAAGGEGVEVVLVHRPPPHDDWSLPKGKLDPGESHRDAAVREVHEETGVRGELGPKLGEVRYDTPAGQEKRVRWWVLRAEEVEGREADDEVDGLRWETPEAAAALLSWDSDRHVLELSLVHLPDT